MMLKNSFKLSIVSMITLLFLNGCVEESSSSSSDTPAVIPTLNLKSWSKTEPQNGFQSMDYAVSVSNSYDQDISFDYALTHITTDDADVTLISGQSTIKKGSRSVNLPLTILGDHIDEDDEEFRLTISNLVNAKSNATGNSIVLTIKDADDKSTVTFNNAYSTAAEGIGSYSVPIQIDPPTQRDVLIPFTVTGLATLNSDYSLISPSPLTVPEGVTEVFIDLNINDDDVREGGESIVLTMNSPLNASVGDIDSMVVNIPGELVLNDTGLTQYYDGQMLAPFPHSDYPMQDADFGLDSNHNGDLDGHAGFSLVKMDNDGNHLAPDSLNYACVEDLNTGLVWEVKDPQSNNLPALWGEALKAHLSEAIRKSELNVNEPDYAAYPYESAHTRWRSAHYQYYWYEKEDALNGGSEGAKGPFFTNSGYPVSNLCAFPSKNSPSYMSGRRSCSMAEYKAAFNELAVCGYKNWDVPTIDELRSIKNYNGADGELTYLPNRTDNPYMSKSPAVEGAGLMWCMDADGSAKYCNKQVANNIRLVRRGQQ